MRSLVTWENNRNYHGIYMQIQLNPWAMPTLWYAHGQVHMSAVTGWSALPFMLQLVDTFRTSTLENNTIEASFVFLNNKDKENSRCRPLHRKRTKDSQTQYVTDSRKLSDGLLLPTWENDKIRITRTHTNLCGQYGRGKCELCFI